MIKKEFQRLLKLELDNDLNSIKIDGIPLWRVIRFSTRTGYLKRKNIYTNRSKKIKINIKQLLCNYWQSRQQLKRFIRSNIHVKNIVFAFPRLTKVDENLYLDRFTDPVIQKTDIKNNYIIFQRNLSGERLTPRIDEEKVIYIEYIDYSIKLYSILLLPKAIFKYRNQIELLFNSAKNIFELSKKDKINMYISINAFFIAQNYYRKIFRKLKPSNVFTVNRSVFAPVIASCNKMDIKTFEFQHGVTLNDTVLYSGVYNKIIDPNFFLAFGENSEAKCFYIPESKFVNIGFAFFSFLKEEKLKKTGDISNILFVSSPNITDKLLLLLEKVVKNLTMSNFVIRLHPQEELSQEQYNIIGRYNNLTIDDNSIDSFLSLLNCDKVIGDKSTVLFEALSLNKSVAKLNYGGFNNTFQQDDGFTYINSIEELLGFIEHKETPQIRDKTYSNFKQNKLNILVKWQEF